MATLTGILEWPERAEGRVRQFANGFLEGSDDPFVPLALGDQYPLRNGQEVTVEVVQRKPRRRRRGGRGKERSARPVVDQVIAIEGMDPASLKDRPKFEDLTVIDPQPRLTLEHPGCPVSCRLIDLFCPIGRGQRALIVSPPKAGKTTLLKDIAAGLKANHPDAEVMALLIDERPEEVTDFRRNVPCEVIASSNDQEVDRHVNLAILALDRAKRKVEAGKHVVILLDSLTRLGRAFNNSRRHANSGRTLSGGLDAKALTVPKQLFGAARNTEEGGSLTVIASCLVDTGSQGDQVIFEEFKGTGNMELILDRKISERRLFPAINLAASGTRKEDLLMHPKELETVTALRRRLLNMPPPQQVEQLLAAMNRFPTNAAMIGLGRGEAQTARVNGAAAG
ncbi:MAG: transcription termination factor Rho [Planctomycetota bacterium]|nr:transcription termination factor Rho [Planctomycetota bacterium]